MTMPNDPWAEIYSEVKLQIPGVIDAVLASVTGSLFKDFCDKTNIWTEDVEVPVAPGTNSYAFSVTKGAPNRLLLVYDPLQGDPNRKWVQGNVQMSVPGIITVSYPPSTATTWRAVVAKTPAKPNAAEGYPDMAADDYWIVDKYSDGLVAGIVASLQAMPGKPYSNDKSAKTNNQYYISERSKARGDVAKANVFGGQRWTYPQGFATIRKGGWA